jgi:DNA-binding CsgD family transcriptional regulator
MTPTLAPVSRVSSRILDLLVFNPTGDDVARALALDFGLKYRVSQVSISLFIADGSVFCLGDYGVTPSQSLSMIPDANYYSDQAADGDLSLKTDYFGWNSDRSAVVAHMKVRFATVGSIVMHFQDPLSQEGLVEVENMMSELIKPLTIFFFNRSPKVTESTAVRDVTPINARAFTPRQKEILKRMAAGETNAAIAGELGFSVSTVRHETMKIYDKLAVSDRHEASLKAIALGLISA